MRCPFQMRKMAAAAAMLALAAGLRAEGNAPPGPAATGALSAYPADCPPLLRQSFDRLQTLIDEGENP